MSSSESNMINKRCMKNAYKFFREIKVNPSYFTVFPETEIDDKLSSIRTCIKLASRISKSMVKEEVYARCLINVNDCITMLKRSREFETMSIQKSLQYYDEKSAAIANLIYSLRICTCYFTGYEICERIGEPYAGEMFIFGLLDFMEKSELCDEVVINRLYAVLPRDVVSREALQNFVDMSLVLFDAKESL